MSQARVMVLGASGLIGRAVATDLAAQGFPVIAVARRFDAAQRAAFGRSASTTPVVDLDTGELTGFLATHAPDLVVNCIGVLQDGPRGDTGAVHRDFIARLLAAIAGQAKPALLVQISIPGDPAEDRTGFSASKREAEALISASGRPYVILRPGFVVAPAAYAAVP